LDRAALAETAGPDGPPRDTCSAGGPAKLASDSNSDRTGTRRRKDETGEPSGNARVGPRPWSRPSV